MIPTHEAWACLSSLPVLPCLRCSGGYGSAGTQPERRLQWDKRQVGRPRAVRLASPCRYPPQSDKSTDRAAPQLPTPLAPWHTSFRSQAGPAWSRPPKLLSVATPQSERPLDLSEMGQTGRRARPISKADALGVPCAPRARAVFQQGSGSGSGDSSPSGVGTLLAPLCSPQR